MEQFGELKKIDLRKIWQNEARNFTPWLADNIEALGDALGMELKVEQREASVGDFSLDLLAKDLGSGKQVVIENQYNQTDHDHLGKLLTYASGIEDTYAVVWVAESIRDEHRQALEWLNQRTDSGTQFFGVVIEVLQIDESKPAPNFKIVVSPNEWQKTTRQQASGQISRIGEAYRAFFQPLVDELREKHRLTKSKKGSTGNWQSFSLGVSGIYLLIKATTDNRIRADVYFEREEKEENKALFDALEKEKETIEKELGMKLEWERQGDNVLHSRISIYRDGSIDSPEDELKEIYEWTIRNFLAFKKVFLPRIKKFF